MLRDSGFCFNPKENVVISTLAYNQPSQAKNSDQLSVGPCYDVFSIFHSLYSGFHACLTCVWDLGCGLSHSSVLEVLSMVNIYTGGMNSSSHVTLWNYFSSSGLFTTSQRLFGSQGLPFLVLGSEPVALVILLCHKLSVTAPISGAHSSREKDSKSWNFVPPS